MHSSLRAVTWEGRAPSDLLRSQGKLVTPRSLGPGAATSIESHWPCCVAVVARQPSRGGRSAARGCQLAGHLGALTLALAAWQESSGHKAAQVWPNAQRDGRLGPSSVGSLQASFEGIARPGSPRPRAALGAGRGGAGAACSCGAPGTLCSSCRARGRCCPAAMAAHGKLRRERGLQAEYETQIKGEKALGSSGPVPCGDLRLWGSPKSPAAGPGPSILPQ